MFSFVELFRLNYKLKPYVSFDWSEEHTDTVCYLMDLDSLRREFNALSQ